MKNSLKIKENILSLENKYPVDEWKIDDIYIWPYIRIKLYIDLLKYSNPDFDDRQPKNITDNISQRGNFRKIKSLIRSVLYLKRLKSDLVQKDIVYFGAHFHRNKVDGKYFNRFFDSLNYLYDLNSRHYTAEFLKIYSENHNQASIINLTKALNAFREYSKFKSKVKPKREKNSCIQLDNYNEFLAQIKSIDEKIDIYKYSIEFLVKWVRKLEYLCEFFDKFYLKVKPKYVIYAGYYGYDALYASILSANRLNIKTVDIQHGPQTNTHMVFTEWQKIPEQGYNLMPAEYWNWDHHSVENIKNWTKNTYIKSKCIGQPYIEYYKMVNDIHIKKNHQILYSLQAKPFNIEDFITPGIIELIKEYSYIWVLRLHPSGHIGEKDIKKYCKQKNITDKVLIQDSKDYPLPLAISESKWHITHFSGCVIESTLLGTPSIIINEFGKKIYQSYIDNKTVYYVNNKSSSFIDHFRNIINNHSSLSTSKRKITIINPFELHHKK